MHDPADSPLLPGAGKMRQRMVERQLVRRGIADRRVLEAMRTVLREVFVAKHLARSAYDDRALPIEAGQTISQPYIVALMAEAAELKPGDRVLEIGTGSGYAAAVLSLIAGHVYTIERHAVLADQARQRLETLGYRNVEVRTGDGTLKGWYCDITRPATLSGGELVVEDLDLDLWRSADGTTVLRLDEDEFEDSLGRQADPGAANPARLALEELERWATDGFRPLLDPAQPDAGAE
jgi:SAM-dependent methyltransferase